MGSDRYAYWLGLKGAESGDEFIGEGLRHDRKIAIGTGSLAYRRGRQNSWCSGEMLRYHEELRLRRQPTKLPLTLMLESVGIKQD